MNREPSIEELFRQTREAVDSEARDSLNELSREGLAWLSLVPAWTSPLARASEFPTGRLSLPKLLDSLVQTGWCDHCPSFAPGEATIEVAKPQAISTLLTGLTSIATGAQRSERSVSSLSISSRQLRWRSDRFSFRGMEPFPSGSHVRAAFRAFSTTKRNPEVTVEPLNIEGEIVECTGDDWTGYEFTVELESRHLDAFGIELYRDFALKSDRRAELIRLLGDVQWMDYCIAAAERVNTAFRSHACGLPPSTRRWLALARHFRGGPGRVARQLLELVDRLLDRHKAYEVTHLLEVGEILAIPFGGEIEMAVRLSQRRLELYYRREADERRLQHYYHRPRQMEVIDHLITHGTPQWAIHYLGAGGTGKTMLMRYLDHDLSRRGMAVARIDFDYIDADFPVRLPGQLLLELADNLQLHMRSDAAEKGFQEFRRRVSEVHRELQISTPPTDPLANLRSTTFASVLFAFCDFLRVLKRPIVLILDTCEELARLQSDGRFQPGVEATFELLERIQQNLAASQVVLRVIFAGRRVLAFQGADWRVRGAASNERRMQFLAYSAPEKLVKEFLGLHEVRGFSGAEATEYLQRRLERTRRTHGPSSALARSEDAEVAIVQAILKRSQVDAPPRDFEWIRRKADEDTEQFNPYDLALFADLIDDVPNIDRKIIEDSNVDPYIQIRILGRQKNEQVLAAFPMLVLLRRLNRSWISELFGVSNEAEENFYRELCVAEWMEYQPAEDAHSAWLEFDRNLLRRLGAYYRQPDHESSLQQAKTRLQQWIKSRSARELKSGKPSEQVILLAVRFLSPDDGAGFWGQLEARIAGSRDWHWAEKICDRLLGQEGDVPLHLQAAVKATLAAARSRVGGPVLQLWEDVEKMASEHPIDPQWLVERGIMGATVARLRRGDTLSTADLQRCWRILRRNPKANWTPFVEAFVDRADVAPNTIPWNALDLDVLWDWQKCDDFSTTTRALVTPLCFWAEKIHHGPSRSRDRLRSRIRPFKAAVQKIASHVSGVQTIENAPDWALPRRVAERLRFEMLEIARSLPDGGGLFDPTQIPIWRKDAIAALDDADGVWLTAKLIEPEYFDVSQPDAEALLRSLTDLSKARTPHAALVPVHRTAEPLFVALARAWRRRGDLTVALQVLDQALLRGTTDQASTGLATRLKAEILETAGMAEQAQLFLNALRNTSANPDRLTIERLEAFLERTPGFTASKWDLCREWTRRKMSWLLWLGTVSGATLLALYVAMIPLSLSVVTARRLDSWPALLLGSVLVTLLMPGLSSTFRRYAPRISGVISNGGRLALRVLAIVAVLMSYIEYRTAINGVGPQLYMYAILAIAAAHLGNRWIFSWDSVCRRGGDIDVQLEIAITGESCLVATLTEHRVPSQIVAREWAHAQACFVFLSNALRRPSTQILAMQKAWHSARNVTSAPWTTKTLFVELPESPIEPAFPVILRLREAGLNQSSSIPVALKVPRELAGALWELQIAEFVGANCRLGLFRHGPPIKYGEADYGWFIGNTRVGPAQRFEAVSPNWSAHFRSAWRQGGARQRSLWRRARDVFSARLHRTFNRRICHLLGEAFPTSAGCRFRWKPESDEAADGVLSPELLLRAERGLFVVQELPTHAVTRTQTAQQQSRVMREFGDELFRGGAYAVLVLPALHPTLAANVISVVARFLNRTRMPSVYTMLDMTYEIRHQIRAGVGIPAADASKAPLRHMFAQIAHEVVLFARSGAYEWPFTSLELRSQNQPCRSPIA